MVQDIFYYGGCVPAFHQPLDSLPLDLKYRSFIYSFVPLFVRYFICYMIHSFISNYTCNGDSLQTEIGGNKTLSSFLG